MDKAYILKKTSYSTSLNPVVSVIGIYHDQDIAEENAKKLRQKLMTDAVQYSVEVAPLNTETMMHRKLNLL